jgi:hypothetical protein
MGQLPLPLQTQSASYLEEDVGAGPMEAVGPGVKCSNKGAAFQGAVAGTQLFCACPPAHGALAVGGHWGDPQWRLGPKALPHSSRPAKLPSLATVPSSPELTRFDRWPW